jgi:hypothetical protein
MTTATHSERESFVLALAKLCPHVSASQVQRLLRLSFAHARLQAESDPKILKIESKIVRLTQDLGVAVCFYFVGKYSIVLLRGNKRLEVPTSLRGEL